MKIFDAIIDQVRASKFSCCLDLAIIAHLRSMERVMIPSIVSVPQSLPAFQIFVTIAYYEVKLFSS